MSIVGVELDTPEVAAEAESNFRPNMVVVGIGGGGGNAVSHRLRHILIQLKPFVSILMRRL